jgi:hypothetical protein
MKTMKMKTLFLILSLITLNSAFSATMKELAGSYDVKSSIASGVAHINEDGSLTAEIYGLVYFECQGANGKLDENIFSVNSTCYNIPTLVKIDLSKVTNLNKFTAPVYTVMGGNLLMEFTRR